MRVSVPITLPAAVFSAIISSKSQMRRLDTSRGHSVLAIMGWIIVGVCPLVSFDAGGGQTAVDIARYVVFRGTSIEMCGTPSRQYPCSWVSLQPSQCW